MFSPDKVGKAIERELGFRKKKLAEARLPHIIECHEKAIVRIVMQRICDHQFTRVCRTAKGNIIIQCTRCKFAFVDS